VELTDLIEHNLAMFFPLFFAALWLMVTALLGLLSGWFRLMVNFPDQTVEPILRIRGQSGTMGLGVRMNGILTLSVCPSGLRIGMMRLFGPFCRNFFVPWESMVVIRKTTLIWPVAELLFGNPVVGRLSISVHVADRMARSAMGRWPESGPFAEETRGDVFRRLLTQWGLATSFAAVFFYPRSTGSCAEWNSPANLVSNSVPGDRLWRGIHGEIPSRNRLMISGMDHDPTIAAPSIGQHCRRRPKPGPDAAGEPLVRFAAVSKRFAGTSAVNRLSLDIFPGEFFALLGPSGCGKTTLLRMLAGFETPDEGRVLLGGDDLAAVPPHRRPVNMMFQSYALFPHLTVAGNIAFGLRQDRLPKPAIAARVEEMLALVKLEGLGARRPDQLSGGQRQRVALARSLAKRPKVLLLDEPMAALDKKLREETQFELIDLQARLGTAFVIVTHDQEEAMTVAHRIAVMDRGEIVQVATPAEIYEQPQSRWVAAFIGDINLIEGGVVAIDTAGAVIEDGGGRRYRVAEAAGAAVGARVAVALRPEKLRIAPLAPLAPLAAAATADGENAVRGRVWDIGYLGDISIYQVRLADGTRMKASVANVTRLVERPIGWDDEVVLSWAPSAAVLLTR
jgi:putrescine transport system ATP-binding protein